MQGASPQAELEGCSSFSKAASGLAHAQELLGENGSLAPSREGCNSSLLLLLAQASREGAAFLPATPEDPRTTRFSVNQGRRTLSRPAEMWGGSVFFHGPLRSSAFPVAGGRGLLVLRGSQGCPSPPSLLHAGPGTHREAPASASPGLRAKAWATCTDEPRKSLPAESGRFDTTQCPESPFPPPPTPPLPSA